MTSNALVKPFGSYTRADLYRLYRDVYTTSEAMSETFEEKFRNVGEFEADIDGLARLQGSIALAAEIGGQPVAYATIRPRRQSRLRHTADLSMGVASSARGQGLGRLVLQAALAQASASSEIEIVYLMVRADNAAAIRLYESLGFDTLAVLERDARIDGRYFDGLLMRAFVRR